MKVDLNGIISIEEIKGYLFPDDFDTEHAIFLFASHKSSTFLTMDFRVLNPSDFDIQSAYHIQVKTEIVGQLIK